MLRFKGLRRLLTLIYLMSLILSFLSPESRGHSQSSSMPWNIYNSLWESDLTADTDLDGVLLIQLIQRLREVT